MMTINGIAFRRNWSKLAKIKPAAFLLLCALGFNSAAHAKESRIITFEAPGADTTPGDNNGTYPAGINDWGVITGSYQDTANALHGFIRSRDGKITTFDAPKAAIGPYTGTAASGINDLGEIVGYYSDSSGASHGFLRSAEGKYTSFDVPGAAGYGTIPVALNLEGAVVGYYTDANYVFHSFVRFPNGKFAAFLAPGQCDGNGSAGCYGSELSNINLFGLSVGNYMDNTANLVQHGLIRSASGKLTSFDAPGAGTGQNQGTGCPGCFAGLNQLGAIAGIYTDANTVFHGYLRYPNGKFTSFDAPGAGTSPFQGTGCLSDCPVSLNDRGTISGVYLDAGNNYHVYLRSPEGKIVSIDPEGSTGTFLVGMNDEDTVTGYYVDAQGVYHGFIRASCD